MLIRVEKKKKKKTIEWKLLRIWLKCKEETTKNSISLLSATLYYILSLNIWKWNKIFYLINKEKKLFIHNN